jgi:hypothetical protein
MTSARRKILPATAIFPLEMALFCVPFCAMIGLRLPQGKCHFVFSYIVDYKHIWQMQKLMKMMKGGNQKKMMRQMEQMKGRGGIPGF